MNFRFNNDGGYKSNTIIFIFCCLIFIAVAVPFHVFFPTSRLRPAYTFSPTFGMIFGFWGALGTAFGNFVADLVFGVPLLVSCIDFVAEFIGGFIAYKLWYAFSFDSKYTQPRFHTFENLSKFLIIILITIYTGTNSLFILLKLRFFENIPPISMEITSIVISCIIGILIISIFNIYGIEMSHPKKRKEHLPK